MRKFNQGKPYHGTSAVKDGRLRGATDTDYFCPKCPDDEMVRLLEYEIRHEQPDNPYNTELHPKAANGFVVAFKIHCQKCGHTDFVKVSNLGWQGGSHAKALR